MKGRGVSWVDWWCWLESGVHDGVYRRAAGVGSGGCDHGNKQLRRKLEGNGGQSIRDWCLLNIENTEILTKAGWKAVRRRVRRMSTTRTVEGGRV